MRGKPKNYSTTVPAPLLSRAQTTNKEERRTKLGDLASLLPLGDEWHPAPQDIDLELSQRAQKKVDKYRRGHAVSCFGCCTSLPAEGACRQKDYHLHQGPWRGSGCRC